MLTIVRYDIAIMAMSELNEDERIIGTMHKFVFRLHRDADAALSKRHASLGQFFTLMTIKHCENASQKDIADLLSLTPAAISRTLDGLVRAKFVERAADTNSRRIKRIRLTKAGTRWLADLKQGVRGIAHAHLKPLSHTDRTELLRILGSLINTAPLK